MITKEQFLERIPENEEYLNTLCKFNPELNTLYESYGMRKIAADLACEQLSTIKKNKPVFLSTPEEIFKSKEPLSVRRPNKVEDKGFLRNNNPNYSIRFIGEEDRIKGVNIIISHTDADGIMSAYIAYQGVDVLYTNTYVVYTNPNCVDDTIKDVLEKYITPENIVHNVIITDLAPSKEYYEELLENPQIKFVYLFDHHKTNESLNGLTPTTFVSEKDETGKAVSATEIIYNYMNKANPSLFNPGVKDYVDLVTSYDTWEWKKSNNQKAKYLSDIFHIIGLENFLDNNLPDDVDILISKYKPVLQYQENSTKCEFEKCNRDLITIATEEYNVGVIFTLTPYISQVCDLILDAHPEIKVMMAFNLPNGCSIRTRDPQIDASELANKISTGGGHPQAAGMSAKPFLDPLIAELTKRLEETNKSITTNLF